jgi:hypothetical protein
LSIFLGKVFDMDFLQKCFYGVFELPLPRNAQKRTKKNAKKKRKSAGGWVGLGFSKCTGGSVDFFGRPLGHAIHYPGRSRGRQKHIGDPRGGWVGQRQKKDQGRLSLSIVFLSCFWTTLTEKRPNT